MNITKIVLATLLLSYSSIQAQEKVSGFIYEDANKNGKKDSKEIGISNVLVSNGVDVVSTNKKGNYQITLTDGQTLFVIKPTNYQFLLDEYNLPKFYYNYRPNGSPALKYEAIKPTGALPKEINFALVPNKENDQFSIFAFGDPQAYTLEEVQFFKDGIVNEIDNKKAVFGISLGDLVGDDLVLHAPYKEVMKAINLPWYNVIGNHDMNYDVTTDEHSDETFEQNFGPANYSFNYGKVHFIILDDILYPDPRDGKGYWGGFREDQLQFIENDLKFVPKDHLIVLSHHIPLEDNNEEWFRVSDRDRLFDLLKDFPNTFSLSAHTHIQQQIHYDKTRGWKQEKPHHEYNVGTTSGDWYSGEKNAKGVPVSTMRDGTPKGYSIIHFNGNNYDVDYKVAGKSHDYQINVFAPKAIKKSEKSRHSVFANVFMGTPTDEVLFSVNGGDWKKMKYTKEEDPAYESTYYKWDVSETAIDGRRPSKSVESTHLWSAKIPANLPVGEYKVKVKATDMYGKVHLGETVYKISE